MQWLNLLLTSIVTLTNTVELSGPGLVPASEAVTWRMIL